MSKAKRKYQKSDKWYKAHKYVKGVKMKDPLNTVAGVHDWSVRVIQPGSEEDISDRLVASEKQNIVLHAKFGCLKDLLIEVLRGK